MKKFKKGEIVFWKSQSWANPKVGYYSHPDSGLRCHYVCEDEWLNGRLYIVSEENIERAVDEIHKQ